MPISKTWKPNTNHNSNSVNASESTAGTSTNEKDTIDSKKDDFKNRKELFPVESPRRSLEQLIVSKETFAQIKSLIAKVFHHEKLYREWGLEDIDPYGNRTAINLYGPPGTGKSFCAEAISNELNRGFIRVNYAEIESKYVGDTPKNIKAAFAKAYETNAVLFFDEADSILGKRLTNVSQSADHGVNVSRSVMLLELDRFNGVAIFATNLASNYDSAFTRRILGHVEMPLPDEESRYKLWKFHIPDRLPNDLNENDFQILVEKSIGLSGGDILNAVISAATQAVQRKNPQAVTLSDITDALEMIYKSQRAINGSLSKGSKIITETVSVDQLKNMK